MQNLPLTRSTNNSPALSLREKSTSDLTQAIHSPGDETLIRERTRTVLKLGYQPDESDAERAKLIEEFVRALRGKPAWAVSKGFDMWVQGYSRRPTPADIFKLTDAAIAPFTREIADRRKAEARQAEPEPRKPTNKAEAQAIMEKAGFTPKRLEMIRRAPPDVSSFEDLDRAADRANAKPHWSHTAAPDSPAMQQLQASRDENPLIKAAREDAARRKQQGAE